MLDIKRMTRSGPIVLHTVRDKLELQLQEKANGIYILILLNWKFLNYKSHITKLVLYNLIS